jgi:hypothetical protein
MTTWRTARSFSTRSGEFTPMVFPLLERRAGAQSTGKPERLSHSSSDIDLRNDSDG